MCENRGQVNSDTPKRISRAEYAFFFHILPEHHERLDGSGYPKGLKGEEISRNAKIVMIADVIDEITTDRSYRGTLEMSDAFMKIREIMGKFSEELIDLLERIINPI